MKLAVIRECYITDDLTQIVLLSIKNRVVSFLTKDKKKQDKTKKHTTFTKFNTCVMQLVTSTVDIRFVDLVQCCF